MPTRILVAPLRYVQGPDALLQMGEQLARLGIGNPLILASRSGRKAIETFLTRALDEKGMPRVFIDFGGECTWKEIERVKGICIEGEHDAIISCGGGKTIDTGRCAAAREGTNVQKFPPEFLPGLGAGVACINVPTVAATDASTSAASLVHTEQGTVDAAVVFPTNPTMVLVDTAVIARSPVRLLVAGMGDALATYFEADMCRRTATPSVGTGAVSTRAAYAIARLCFDILMEHGLQARAEAQAKIAGPGIDAVVEANVLLSGLGFESCGLSAAHAVGNAFEHITHLFERPQFHGERVAFGTLVQLVMESRESEFLQRIFAFCKSVGLPTTFDELTLKHITDAALETVADVASKDVLIRSMCGANKEPDSRGRFYDEREILNGLKAADAFGRACT